MVSTLVGSGLGHYVVSEHARVPLQHHLASLYGIYFGWIRFETTLDQHMPKECLSDVTWLLCMVSTLVGSGLRPLNCTIAEDDSLRMYSVLNN